VVYAVYEAKREAADYTMGIGAQTDLIILQDRKPQVCLTRDDFAALDKSLAIMRPRQLSPEAREIVQGILDGKHA
jgi:hypothetical protein